MAEYITEIKRHINKPDQAFRCELVVREPDHLVLRYVSDRTGRIGDVVFDPGSTTLAHYWSDRGYVAWRMYDPAGDLKGHVFHICRDVRIEEDRVSYLDMLLDIWVSSEGRVSVLDEEEVRACAEDGRILEKDLTWIETCKGEVVENLTSILDEVSDIRV